MFKNWRLGTKIMGCLFFGIVIMLTVSAVLHTVSKKEPHWTDTRIVDRTEKPFSITVTSVREGLPVATAEAQKWREDVVLTGVSAFLEGAEAVKSRKGIIIYSYVAVNNDTVGSSRAYCDIELDIKKQAIIGMYTNRGFSPVSGIKRGSDSSEELIGYLDIDEILDALESSEMFVYSDDPIVTIRMGWEKSVVVVNNELGVGEGFYINNSTKQIVGIGKLATPG
ncbi:hypothetical protein LJC10_06315, partial [Selenomonadales bacterium OttesenSCG-928-I06]|nr:hypothetical protein [Selenomonadales bacterium OttesenSCG-928-I06]